MQFDEFDKKVTEAANHHHPAYDEKAWGKMEKLLDQHLPQKEDKRKRILFLLLILVGLGGAGLIISKSLSTAKRDIAITQPPHQSLKNTDESKPSVAPPSVAIEPAFSITNEVAVGKSGTTQQNTSPVLLSGNMRQTRNKTWNQDIHEPIANTNNSAPVKAGQTFILKATTSDKPTTQNQLVVMRIDDPVATDDSNKLTQTADKSVTKKDSPQEKSTDQKKKSRASNLFFTLSAGPDISYASGNKVGPTKARVGIGAGYTFNDRITLRTGFYSSRKVYTALPDAYKPSDNFSSMYPYLDKVDADCRIFEVPLTLSYNISHSKKTNIMATAGLTSYIMKKEDYEYSYAYTAGGQIYKHQQTVTNGSKHFLAGLSLSAGYERKLTDRVSVMAEPYLNVPLSGIGYGKVKLNNTGVLFSIKFKPFK